MLEWMVDKQIIKRGYQISDLPLHAKNSTLNRYQERTKTREPTFVAVLNREDYTKLVKRRNGDIERKKIEFI